MPNIASLTRPLAGYHHVEAPRPSLHNLIPDSPIDPFSRCPVPQIGNPASFDSINQSDRKGAVPQYRVFVSI